MALTICEYLLKTRAQIRAITAGHLSGWVIVFPTRTDKRAVVGPICDQSRTGVFTNLNIASIAASDTTHFNFLRASSSDKVGRSVGGAGSPSGALGVGGAGSAGSPIGALGGGVGSGDAGVGSGAAPGALGSGAGPVGPGGVTNGEIVGSADGPDAGTEFPR